MYLTWIDVQNNMINTFPDGFLFLSLRRTVYLCRRLSDQKLIIIKQIPVEQMTREERQVAVNEAKVLAMLDHPNIIEYYENFLEDKALSIVMEYAEGKKPRISCPNLNHCPNYRSDLSISCIHTCQEAENIMPQLESLSQLSIRPVNIMYPYLARS